MSTLWAELSPAAQDGLILLALLLPVILIGVLVLRGFQPWPFVRAVLWRFRWANLMFVALIAISVGIGVALLAQERGLRHGTAQAADKFDLVVAAPGSEVTMMLAAVYLQPSDAPLISGSVFEKIANDDRVAVAAPLGFGDSFRGHPVVGTTPEFLSYLSDNQIAGRVFGGLFEAVIGAAVPLAPGDHFEPAHGMIAPDDAGDDHATHDGADFAVVGQMAPTGTPWDNAIIVPIEAVWAVHGLANGHAPERADQIGPPFDADYFPGTPAVIVHAEQLWANYALRSELTRAGETMAFFPGAVLAQLYTVMGDVRQVMSIMSLVTQVLVAASVLLGLLILVLLLRRQLALLRALGAPTRFVFAVVWSYAAVLLGAGALAGLVVGQLATVVLSRIVTARTDIAVSAPLGWPEYHLVAGFVCLAALLALIPAWAVLRSPVVDGLRA